MTSKSLRFGRLTQTHTSSDSSRRYNKNASIISWCLARRTSITSVRSIASITTWRGLISHSRTLYFRPQKLNALRSRKSNHPPRNDSTIEHPLQRTTRRPAEALFAESGLSQFAILVVFPSIQLLEMKTKSGLAITMASDIRKAPRQSIAGIGTA